MLYLGEDAQFDRKTDFGNMLLTACRNLIFKVHRNDLVCCHSPAINLQ